MVYFELRPPVPHQDDVAAPLTYSFHHDEALSVWRHVEVVGEHSRIGKQVGFDVGTAEQLVRRPVLEFLRGVHIYGHENVVPDEVDLGTTRIPSREATAVDRHPPRPSPSGKG